MAHSLYKQIKSATFLKISVGLHLFSVEETTKIPINSFLNRNHPHIDWPEANQIFKCSIIEFVQEVMVSTSIITPENTVEFYIGFKNMPASHIQESFPLSHFASKFSEQEYEKLQKEKRQIINTEALYEDLMNWRWKHLCCKWKLE